MLKIERIYKGELSCYKIKCATVSFLVIRASSDHLPNSFFSDFGFIVYFVFSKSKAQLLRIGFVSQDSYLL